MKKMKKFNKKNRHYRVTKPSPTNDGSERMYWIDPETGKLGKQYDKDAMIDILTKKELIEVLDLIHEETGDVFLELKIEIFEFREYKK